MNTIDENKLYSLGEIVREKLIPGIDTIPKASRLVNGQHRATLKPKVAKRGFSGMQYKVKGSNIIQFLENNEKRN
jgi:hypothetical protein